MIEVRNTHIILVGKPNERFPRRIGDDSIKTDLKEIVRVFRLNSYRAVWDLMSQLTSLIWFPGNQQEGSI